MKASQMKLGRSQKVTLAVLLVLMGVFYYLQWPTRVRPVPTPDIAVQLPVSGYTVWFEREPSREEHVAAGALTGPQQATNWQVNHRGINMLVQELVYSEGVLEQRMRQVMSDAIAADQAGFEGQLISHHSQGDAQVYRLQQEGGRTFVGVLMVHPPALVKVGIVYTGSERAARAQAILEKLL
ncbi:hypothetical protein NFC81_00140 [Salinispirillum sp. LH 10-3-1]|uniref:DUF1795 domain-containing protein n=1 Tax=Salinispirillum sp. LH 10-3-1 TaxID=2952525 RepID=A0AB38YFZ5_9GAMM